MFDIKITGIGAYIPDYIETSKALASKINKTEEWINSRTGVRERRISTIDVDQMGAFAAKQAIESVLVSISHADLYATATAIGT